MTIVVLGVSGLGKTTVGTALADALGPKLAVRQPTLFAMGALDDPIDASPAVAASTSMRELPPVNCRNAVGIFMVTDMNKSSFQLCNANC